MKSDTTGRRHRSAVFLGVLCLAACGDSVVPGPPASQETAITVVEPPSLRVAAPGRLSAGDTLTVLGSGFDPNMDIVLQITGTFTPAFGPAEPVDFAVPARFVDSGRVEWVFEPDVPPAGFGNTVGVLDASITAVQSDSDVASDPSAALNVTLDVAPSLILWEASPANTVCGARFVHTTVVPSVPISRLFEIEVEAVGLEEPVELRASWLVVSEQQDNNVIESEGDRIRTQTLPARQGTFLIDPRFLTLGTLSGNIPITLVAEGADGTLLQRTYDLELRRESIVEYDGNVVVRELLAPVQVSSCLPGGEFGRNVTYNSGQNETRNRSFTLSASLNLDLWIVDAGFGFSTSQAVSSSESESLSLSGRVPPGQFGVFYRQTERLERTGAVVTTDVCGNRFEAGRAFVTDWNWAPDLALTTSGSCPPAPPSNLPAAEVFQ
ncbi:MAG: hypothetical protein AAFX94_02640 [Myxococcota bacterium]